MSGLGDYLAAAATRPFDYGHQDCCTFPADWVLLRRGVDPMANLRGRYASEEEAQEIIEDAGGLVAIWTRELDAAGIGSVATAREGDIGVIAVIGEHGLTANGGIFTGKRWAFLAPRGLFASSIEPAHVMKVWRVG
jgi:hypothetical protein